MLSEHYAAAFGIIKHDQFGGQSMMVWGGISMESYADLDVMDNGTLNGVGYKDEILWCRTMLDL